MGNENEEIELLEEINAELEREIVKREIRKEQRNWRR